MATEVRFRRGTTAEHLTFTGAEGEVTVNTDTRSLHVHDGVTPGGHETARAADVVAATDLASSDPGKGAAMVANATARVSSIADLRAMPKPTRVTTVIVEGYYAGRTRGGGAFVCNPNDSGATDNHGTIIVGADGAVWRRQFSGNVDVSWFGARGEFSAEDAAIYFSRAAAAAPAIVNQSAEFGLSVFPRAPRCEINVPDGIYVIDSLVDVGNKDVIWRFSNAARLTGSSANRLNGAIVRPNGRISRKAYGTTDSATGFSIANDGPHPDKSPGITGIAYPSDLVDVQSIDSCALFTGNYSPPALHVAPTVAAYTSDTVTLNTPLSADQMKRLRRGMILETMHHRFEKWQGVLDSWSSDGLTLTVSPGWYFWGGPKTVSTPTNDAGVVISGMGKIWGQNTALALEADGFAYQAIGHEFSVYNSKESSGDNFDIQDEGTRVWGILIATGADDNLYCQVGVHIKGHWRHGFVANRHQDYGYTAWYSQKIGFYYRGSGEAFRIENQARDTHYSISNIGNVTVGTPDTFSAGKIVSYRTSGLGTLYDTRVTYSGGTEVNGKGTVTTEAALSVFTGVIRHSGDATYSLGTADHRWSEVFAATGTINTSDGRQKTAPEPITDEVLDAWADVSLVAYQWLSSIAQKGEAARTHIGVIAQQIDEAFKARGLDATRYGLLCYDRWDDEYEPIMEERDVFDWVEREIREEGQPVRSKRVYEKVGTELYDTGNRRLVRESGDSWGIRAEQCLFLEAALQRKKMILLEERIRLLEMHND